MVSPTFEQPDFALVYFAVGGFFATFVFAISVIAVPLMFDRKTDAVTATIASLVACSRNPVPLLLWAACIAVLAGIGFATFVGLIVAGRTRNVARLSRYRRTGRAAECNCRALLSGAGRLLRQTVQKIEALQRWPRLGQPTEPAIMNGVDLATTAEASRTRFTARRKSASLRRSIKA